MSKIRSISGIVMVGSIKSSQQSLRVPGSRWGVALVPGSKVTFFSLAAISISKSYSEENEDNDDVTRDGVDSESCNGQYGAFE